ncbi:MAG: nucleotidyltransferase domain-containing protein [Prevotella sp.]|nr:nucleotidyltransferase domain-containing protein [Candidatus Prevotella equi]
MKIREEDIPVLNRIKSLGQEKLSDGGRIILYGSRARGDARKDSDWDLLVLLNKKNIEQSDYDGICYDLTSLGWDIGEQIIPVIYTTEEWNYNSFTPFYKNVESEGIRIL